MILLANDVPLLQAGSNTGYAEGCEGQGLKRLVVKLAETRWQAHKAKICQRGPGGRGLGVKEAMEALNGFYLMQRVHGELSSLCLFFGKIGTNTKD